MVSDGVEQHYTQGGLMGSVLDAIVQAGYDPDDLTAEALAPMDEFHTFGRAATIALADALGIAASDAVLDVGSGLGGPARYLASRYGCRVTGIDLTQELVDVAANLTARVGLSDLVDFHRGDALDMPFEDGAFDVVWTQHTSMNIPDKAALFAEMRRVVQPGGRLGFFDILAGPVQPVHFPVPWAEDDSVSFLASPEETRSTLASQGFEVRTWEDLTADAVEFYKSLSEAPSAPSPLGIHLLIPNLAVKGPNLRRNAEERRIAITRCVADAV